MKYDIAKNEDGPLRKTMKRTQDGQASQPSAEKAEQQSPEVTAARYPALDERLRNLETHVAVRYGESRPTLFTTTVLTFIKVPSPPRSLLDRLKFIEDHLVRLEKDYPPWAALHFNQPHRGVRNRGLPVFANANRQL